MTKQTSFFSCVLSSAFEDDEETALQITAKPKSKKDEAADDDRDAEALAKLAKDAAENGKESKAVKATEPLSK